MAIWKIIETWWLPGHIIAMLGCNYVIMVLPVLIFKSGTCKANIVFNIYTVFPLFNPFAVLCTINPVWPI
jgi:hypothetical protein